MMYFLELVDAEDASRVPSVRADFLAEAGRDSGVFLGQFRLFDPLVAVEGGDGLLRRGNQILLLHFLVFGLLAAFADDFVELVIELRELRYFLHDILAHKERSAHRTVALLQQHSQRQLNQSLDKSPFDYNSVTCYHNDWCSTCSRKTMGPIR